MPDDEASLDAFAARTQSFLDEKSALKEEAYNTKGNYSAKYQSPQDHTYPIQLKPFDPNQVSLQQWLSMGFPQWLAERILKFREKGGKFKNAEDLGKIYGMPPELFQKVKPFIINPADNKANSAPAQAISFTIIELNGADSARLIAVPGLSPYMISRILKYRNRLGGFISKDQLSEIYGMNPETLGKFLKYFSVDSTLIKKINLNTCDFKDLMKHPYGSYAIAKAICKFREKYGKIKVVREVRQSQILPDTVYIKFAPYLMGDE